jgi:HD-like signal output (HDOD) protein/prolyl-tRNA editing enzyme YbaK/EbsC (Cys-tRNA(Pro) deacylase)
MEIPNNIKNFLRQSNTPYEIMRHPRTTTLPQAAGACHLELSDLVRAVMLVDAGGPLMAILPADHLLDFESIHSVTGRSFEFIPDDRLHEIFTDCEPGSFPPLAPAYGLDVIIDTALSERDAIVFEPGSRTSLLRMTGAAFKNLFPTAAYAPIAQSARAIGELIGDRDSAVVEHRIVHLTPARVRRDLQEFHELPVLPSTAGHLLQLASNPLSNARQLAGIIAQDASLAAQVMRYANSSLYGYAGSVNDLQTAIARVLGFDFVLNLALGLTIGKSLRIPADGPLGLEAFWRHSVYSARLVECLARQIEGRERPARGAAYLAGLLQNIGRLVLGHTFQPEFFLLNQLAMINPQIATTDLETSVLGVTHDQIGAWLMEAWGMPASLITGVRYHHDAGYWGKDAVYPQLILIANHHLARLGIGETGDGQSPQFAQEMLGLDAIVVELLAEQVVENALELDDLARRLSA